MVIHRQLRGHNLALNLIKLQSRNLMIQLQLSHTLPQLQLRRRLKLGIRDLTRHSLASDLSRIHLHLHRRQPVLPGFKAQPRHSSLLFPNPTILTASTVSNINNSNCSQLVKLDHSILSNQLVVLMFQEALQRLFHLVLQFHSKPANVAKGSARPSLVPVHDRSTGKLSYYVQADATDDSAVAGEDSGPFMTFGATEDSAGASEEQAYYVGSDGVYHPYN